MQSRCSLSVAAQSCMERMRRPMQNGISFRASRRLMMMTDQRFSTSSMRARQALGPSLRRPRGRSYHSSCIPCELRTLHTTPSLSVPFMSATMDEEDDEYVSRIANAHLSELLKDDMYTSHESDWPSLDDELGETSVWDKPFEEEGDEVLDPEPTRYVRPRRAPKRSAHEMLLRFDPQSPPQSGNLEDMELWLECEAQRECTLKYQHVIDSARERKDYASLSMIQKQILHWYPSLKDAIEREQKAYLTKSSKLKKDMNRYGPFLCTLPPQKLAVIVAHECVINTLQRGTNGVTLVSAAKMIGSAVEAEVNIQYVLQQQVEESRRVSKELNDDESDADSVNADGQSHIASPSTDSDLEEPDQEADHPKEIFSDWMYGATHLQKFIDEAHKSDPSKKTRIRINSANRRARRLLRNSKEWREADKVKLGVALIEVLLQNAVIDQSEEPEKAFRYEKVYLSKDKFVGRLFLHDKIYNMAVEDSWANLEAATTRHKPMILPPRDWVAPDDGGYSWLKVDLMRTKGCKLQKEALFQADLSTVFDGLNVLGQVPWSINTFVLDVAQRCWRDDIPLGDIPSRANYVVPPKPVKPVYNTDEQDIDAVKAAKAEYRSYREALTKYNRINQKNMDLRSLRCSAILKLDQAEKFKEFDEIFFPYNLDFRGRAYPVPPHLSNVGSDLCRGLLKFAEAKPLGPRGLYWLKVHLANLAGNDKLTFDDRAEFTDQNMDNIRASVTDPFGENRWWMSLEDPFQGLATCQEIVNAIDSGDPESYMCSVPVHMDGSCNGLQHYAALGRDKVGGQAVNLCNMDTPQDVYIGVMHEVVRRVAEEAAVDLDFEVKDPHELSKIEKDALKRNQAAKLLNGLIDRGAVKRTVMTSVYGVTYIGARKQIQEKIEEKLAEKGYDIDEMDKEIHAACGFLARLTMDVMGELFTGARETMKWLATCARLIAQLDQPVAWVSPIGVPVIQPYRQKKPYTIVTLLQSVVLLDKSDDLPLHKQRQATAFPPNYVHSLDSSHMLLTALEMDRRGLTFSAVHDSFWTHACDVDEMNEALRDCFVELYEQPLLERLKKTWELRYPSIQFPDLPERGDLDLNEVRSAPYFFQ